MSRVLAGFEDGRADEGVGAGEASLVGLRLAREKGWRAPTVEFTNPPSRTSGGSTSDGTRSE